MLHAFFFGMFARLIAVSALACSSVACAPAHEAPAQTIPPASRTADPGLVTIDGEIIRVDRMSPADRLASGVRLTVRPAADRPVDVDLGPGWWLDEQGLHFGTSERVQVLGAPSSARDNGFVAWQVTSGTHTVRLRDEQGRPLWPAEPVNNPTPVNSPTH